MMLRMLVAHLLKHPGPVESKRQEAEPQVDASLDEGGGVIYSRYTITIV